MVWQWYNDVYTTKKRIDFLSFKRLWKGMEMYDFHYIILPFLSSGIITFPQLS